MSKRVPPSRNEPIVPGEEGLGLVAQQAWGELVSSGAYRLVHRPSTSAGWVTVQQYYVLPSRREPHLLLPAVDRRALGLILGAYSGLRAPRPRAARRLVSLGAQLGLPVSRDRVGLQRALTWSGTAEEPLAKISEALGRDLVATLGVRRGANAKATLALYERTGRAAGLAKLSWNRLTAAYVRNEGTVLGALDGVAGAARTPRLMLSGEIDGHPFLVASPLPPSVRQDSRHGALSMQELTGLFPVVRLGVPASSRQLRGVVSRFDAYHPGQATRFEGLYRELRSALMRSPMQVRMAQRWHGDLVPWNVGRDRAGSLWAWDWEASEEDVVAGLDAIHWYVHTRPAVGRSSAAAALSAALPAVEPALRSLGYAAGQQRLVAGIYALVIAERAAGLADANGSWARVKVDAAQTAELLRLGLQLVGRADAD